MHEALDLAQLRGDLRDAGSPWEMDTTTITALTEDERRIRLGVTPPPGQPTVEDIHLALEEGVLTPPTATAEESAGAPAAFDFRNVSGQNYVTPVKDQGGCGSCVAFGTVATLETTAAWEQRDPALALNLSEAHLFYCHGRAAGRTCANGWWPEAALIACRDTGITYEDYYPYTAADQNCTNLNADWRNRLAKVSSLQHASTTAAMKTWISTKGPLAACFIVYQDFFSYRSGVYRHVSGGQAGGHCVAIIGYDDAQGCWICKNSWGTGWGEGGYFKIAYGQCGIESWLGPWGGAGVSLTLWRSNVTVRGAWANESARNAWVYLNGIGWRKIASESDQITLSMLSQLIAAKAAARPVSVFDDAGTIKQLYVV